MTPIHDQLNRPLRDVRISVTDRCNFRCRYCMPREIFDGKYRFLMHEDILTFEEIARLAGVLLGLGVRKVRLTGGEPLVRRDIERLVAMLARLPGLEDLTLTTNGSLLVEKAGALRDAGLHRLTVSLDSLDEETFHAMSDADCPVSRVLDGIDAARRVGFSTIKVNTVVQRGVNDGGLVDMARHFHGTGIAVRFIEYMDVGTTNGWSMDHVVPASEILDRIHSALPLEPVPSEDAHAVARRYRYRDGEGEIGVIASVTQPFCGGCTRLRLSSEGKLYTCLFAGSGHNLRAALRAGASDGEIAESVRSLWESRADRYSELRSLPMAGTQKVEMSHIGG